MARRRCLENCSLFLVLGNVERERRRTATMIFTMKFFSTLNCRQTAPPQLALCSIPRSFSLSFPPPGVGLPPTVFAIIRSRVMIRKEQLILLGLPLLTFIELSSQYQLDSLSLFKRWIVDGLHRDLGTSKHVSLPLHTWSRCVQSSLIG